MLFNIIKNEKGQVFVLTAFLFIILCGFVGLAIDISIILYNQNKLQNSVDFTALSAVQEATDSTKVNESAINIANQNGIPTENLEVTYPYSDQNSTFKVKVSADKSVTLVFLPVLGIEKNKTVHASAVAEAKKIFPIVIFAKNDSETSDINSDINVNSAGTINGSIHSNGNVRLHNKLTVNGTVSAVGTIEKDEKASTNGLIPSSDSKEIPEFNTDNTIGAYPHSGDLHINSLEDFSKFQGYDKIIIYGDLHVNTPINITEDQIIFVQGSVHINNPITGTGKIITLGDGDIVFNGTNINFGSSGITFSAGGNIEFAGTNSTFSGIFYTENHIKLASSNSTYYSRFYCGYIDITGNNFHISPPKDYSYDRRSVLIE